MNNTPAYQDPVDLQAISARIARAQGETRKFVAEQNKLTAEAKSAAEIRGFC